MLGLLELQRAFALGLANGEGVPLAAMIKAGPIGVEDRLRIYRNTMRGALTGALALTFPAVAALVGPAFFDQAAYAFARRHPPRAPLLSLYGEEFPAFLAGYELAATLPYLPDVAKLEWAVEQAAQTPAEDEIAPAAIVSLPGVTLSLSSSLALLDVAYPVELIWRAVLAGDDAALAAIDPLPARSTLAIWRDGDSAGVVGLRPGATAFLRSVLAGADAETALTAAGAAAADPVSEIAAEIFPAGFSRLTPYP